MSDLLDEEKDVYSENIQQVKERVQSAISLSLTAFFLFGKHPLNRLIDE